MSHIINKKVGNAIYVYEQICYRENGRVRTKQRILGKRDVDGNVIPSKKRASAEAAFPASLNNSQNSSTSTNAGTLGTLGTLGTIESNHGNDGVGITTSANVSNDNNANNPNTTPISGNSGLTSIPATATNALIAAATVANGVNNVSNTPNMSATPAAMSATPNTKNTPVADNISDNVNNVSYDTFTEKHVETTLASSLDKPIASQVSETFTNTDEASQIHQTPHTATEPAISAVPEIPVSATTVPYIPQIVDGTVENLDYTDNTPWELQAADNSSQRNLPQVVSKKPTHFKMGTTKVENTLFDPIKNESIYEATGINDVKINVSRRNSQKKRIETLLYIDFNAAKVNGLTISNEDRITPYDREIYNAVATLVAAGNDHISPNMIFQLLSGNTSDARNKMSEETREKIIRSVYKMRATMIRVNATAEVKAGMMAEGIFEGYLIPAARVEIILNGQRIKDCIRIIDPLPLFSYASKKNQIASIDISLLDTPLNNTPENIELKAYLLRRILSMSNAKNNMRDVIRYDTLYDYLRITAPNPNQLKKKHKNIRDKTKILLDFWKGEKLIKDYKEEREGKTIAKIIIYR